MSNSELIERDLTSCSLRSAKVPAVGARYPSALVRAVRQERSDDTYDCGPAACLIAKGRANKVSDQGLTLVREPQVLLEWRSKRQPCSSRPPDAQLLSIGTIAGKSLDNPALESGFLPAR